MSRRVEVPVLAPARACAGVVDVLTGYEPTVIPMPAGPLSAEDAQALTERIRLTAQTLRDRIVRLHDLLEQARDGQAWAALGYPSWTAYLSATLSAEPMRLAKAERREIVSYLTGQGLSTRAIAPIVGADQKTITNDRRTPTPASAGEEVSSPAPSAAPVIGLDGKVYPVRPRLVAVPAPEDHALASVPMPAPVDALAFVDLLHAQLERTGALTADDWRAAVAASARAARAHG